MSHTIRKISFWPVIVPLRNYLKSVHGTKNYTERIIIKVETDTNHGWGEIYGINGIRNMRIYEQKFSNRYIKIDKYIIKHHDYGCLEIDNKINNSCVLGIRMALLDIEAKDKKIPLYKHLREKYNTKYNNNNVIKFSSYSYDGNSKEVIKNLEDGLKIHNHKYLELKLGLRGFNKDIQLVKDVRKHFGGEYKFGVDMNMSYKYGDAIKFLCSIDNQDINNIEEMCKSLCSINNFAKVFPKINFSTHCVNIHDIYKYHNIHGIVPDPHITDIFNLNSTKNMWLRSCNELGISFTHMCHLSMALDFGRASQSLYNYNKHSLLKEECFNKKDDGIILKNDIIGSGVEIDLKKLYHYHKKYTNLFI